MGGLNQNGDDEGTIGNEMLVNIDDKKFNKICLKVMQRFKNGGLPLCEVQVTFQSGCQNVTVTLTKLWPLPFFFLKRNCSQKCLKIKILDFWLLLAVNTMSFGLNWSILEYFCTFDIKNVKEYL